MESVETLQFEQMAEQLKLLSDRSRLHLLALLLHAELCVCDLVELTKLSQPNVSQHMRKLKSGRLVSETKKGQWVYYALRKDVSSYVRDVIQQLPSLEVEVQALKSSGVDCCVTEPLLIGGMRAEKISG